MKVVVGSSTLILWPESHLEGDGRDWIEKDPTERETNNLDRWKSVISVRNRGETLPCGQVQRRQSVKRKGSFSCLTGRGRTRREGVENVQGNVLRISDALWVKDRAVDKRRR